MLPVEASYCMTVSLCIHRAKNRKEKDKSEEQ
jgi:hypothetical protein